MNIQKAKEILSSTQWKDQEDPLVKEAMEFSEGNPELKEWLEEQQRLDPLIVNALNEVPVPENMEKILLDAVEQGQERKRPDSRKAAWGISIAAILCLGIGSLFLLRSESLVQSIQSQVSGKNYKEMADFRDGMAFYIAETYFKLDHVTNDLGSIGTWLEGNKVPNFEDLPDALVRLNPIGCKELSWNNEKVSLVCFHSVGGKIVHLFILDRKDDNHGFEDIATVADIYGLETGGWLENGKVYLLVGSDPDVDIEFALT